MLSGNFAEKTTSTPFRDLLHGANLRHGTDGFTSPPKKGVLRILSLFKNLTASAGFEPANLGTKGQHATPRPPKPLLLKYLIINFMVTPCMKWCRTLFIYQLTHTTLRNVELLKHSKIDKNAPTKPKHVGAFLSILECFNNSTFLTLCASVGNKKCSRYRRFCCGSLKEVGHLEDLGSW